MTEQRTKIIIETDAGRSEQVLRSVQKGLQGVAGEAVKTGNSVKSGTGLMDSALSSTALSAAAFGVALKSAFSMAKEASNLSEARLYLQTFAADMGVSYEKLDQTTKKATNGLVDNLTLIRMNHKALKLGVSTDVNDLARLWQISDAVGDEFGQSIEKTFEQITNAIGTGNAKALISLGLLPESFKGATDKASLLEQRVKMLKTVFEQAGAGADSLGQHGTTVNDKFTQMDVAIKNLKTAFGEALIPIFLPVAEGLTMIANAAADVIAKFSQLADISGPKNQFLGKTIEELKTLRAEAANRVGLSGSKLSALTDPSQSYRRASNSDATTSIMAAEVQYQGELAILKQIDAAISNLETKTKARAESQTIIVATTEEETKAKTKLTDAQKAFNKAQEEASKLIAQSAEAFLYGFGVKTIGNLKEAENLLISMSAAAGGFAIGLKDGTTEAGKLLEESEKISKKFEELNTNIVSTLSGAGRNWSKELASLSPENAASGMMNFMSSGLFSAQGDRSKDALKDIKEPLAKTIAEAVQTGFANADFSNLSRTLADILGNVLSQSVSASNPILNKGGSINFGNLGINLAADFAVKALTQPGRFFGGREEHGKEAIEQAATLKDKMSATYLASYETNNLAYLYSGRGRNYLNELAAGRNSYFGTTTGYSYNDSGDGIFSDRTRTYALVDNGASAALAKLTEAMDRAEKYNRNVEMSYELMTAQGQDYKVLAEQAAAYAEASRFVSSDTRQLNWTDGTNSKIDLAESAHEIKTAAAELARQLGQATAERSSSIAQGFAKYSPWLNSIQTSNMGMSSGLRVSMREMPGMTNLTGMDSLSTGQQYDAFSSLQTDFMDRKISSYLIDMVKQSGSSQYELEKLKFSDSEAYAGKYLEYVEAQVEAFEEVMKRQEQIFNDATKSFEERSAALATFESAQEAYYQGKLDSLAAEQAAEEAVKQKELEASVRSRDKMASALNLYGEIAQSGTKVYVLYGGNRDVAYAELIRQNSDNPEVVSALKGAEAHNQGVVLWGEK